MTPTVYLHVGPHKTGSTYLQDIFTRQAKSLERQGIIYPAVGREYSTGHHNIAAYFTERRLINTSREELSSGLSRLENEWNKDILLSSENFSFFTELQLLNLKKVFPHRNFHILYFLRRGGAYIVSLWQEKVKNGLAEPLNHATRAAMVGLRDYDPFDYDGNLVRYQRGLEGTLSVFDFNELLTAKTDLTRPISETIKAEIKPEKRILNPRLPAEITELIRAANLYNAELGKRRGTYPRLICHRMLKIPLLGTILKNYVNREFNKLYHTLPARDFLDMGYQPSHLLDSDMNTFFKYIPGSSLLDKLNEDNFFLWRIIKKIIREKQNIKRNNG